MSVRLSWNHHILIVVLILAQECVSLSITADTEPPWVEDSRVTLTCTMTYISAMSWKLDSSDIAKCDATVCTTLKNERGLFMYSFDTANSIFTLSITSVTMGLRGRLFECFNESTSVKYQADVKAKDPVTDAALIVGGLGLAFALVSILGVIGAFCRTISRIEGIGLPKWAEIDQRIKAIVQSEFNERIKAIVQSDEFNERIKAIVQSDEFNERIKAIVQSDEFNERIKAIVQSDEFNERIKAIVQSDEFNERIANLNKHRWLKTNQGLNKEAQEHDVHSHERIVQMEHKMTQPLK